MKTEIEQREPSYGDLAAFLRRGVAFALIVGVVAGGTTFLVRSRVAPTYEAHATLLIAQPNAELRALAGGVVTPSEVDASVYQAAATTDAVASAALARLGVAEPTRQELQAFVRRLDVSFDETRVSSLLHVRVRANESALAADEANALVASLRAWDERRAMTSVLRVVETLEAQVRGLEEQIAALQAASAAEETIDERIALRETQRSQLALARALQTRTIGLLEDFAVARPPLESVAPRVVRDAVLAALAGIVLAYALLLVRGASDGRYRTVEDLVRGTGLPVLAEFPPLRRGARGVSREATSYLRSNLQLAAARERPIVVVVSAVEWTTDGTFGVSLGLAESFARNGQRTLLIDSNLRKSMPRRGPSGDYADLSSDQPSFREHLEHPTGPLRPTSIDVGVDASLDLIASFDPAPYPAELLSRSFETVLRRFREHYDVIVIDSAPVLAVSDPLVLAPHASGVVLVASLQDATHRGVRQALELLAPVRSRLVGLVALHVPRVRTRPPPRTAAAESTREQAPRVRSASVSVREAVKSKTRVQGR